MNRGGVQAVQKLSPFCISNSGWVKNEDNSETKITLCKNEDNSRLRRVAMPAVGPLWPPAGRGQTDREHGSEPLKARIRAHGRNGGREVAGRLERSPAAKAGQQRPRKGHRQPMPMSREALQALQGPSPADPLPQWRPSPLKQRIGSDSFEQCQHVARLNTAGGILAACAAVLRYARLPACQRHARHRGGAEWRAAEPEPAVGSDLAARHSAHPDRGQRVRQPTRARAQFTSSPTYESGLLK